VNDDVYDYIERDEPGGMFVSQLRVRTVLSRVDGRKNTTTGKWQENGGDAMRHQTNSIAYARSSRSRKVQGTMDEAVMRKEILTSLLFGVIGLLAPFIFVLLLRSNPHVWVH
jgi:hypothetical protein